MWDSYLFALFFIAYFKNFAVPEKRAQQEFRWKQFSVSFHTMKILKVSKSFAPAQAMRCVCVPPDTRELLDVKL